MSPIISIKNIIKTFDNINNVLKGVSLDIMEGEIIALLGPNGAGKTTMISLVCGILSPSGGSIEVNGFDVIKDYKKTRSLIGLVPQEILLESFETVMNTVRFSRGLFGKPKDDVFIQKILTQLSLWDKRDIRIMALSGGMKRRVLIAKALSHEPKILFLDEPTAGVDVELRKDMWNIIRDLQKNGTTIILTTHYIEEAEEIADRVGIMRNGDLLLVEEKNTLLEKMGSKKLTIDLKDYLHSIPKKLSIYNLSLSKNGMSLTYNYNKSEERTGITRLLLDINKVGLQLSDLKTNQTSLEDIFVDLVKE